MHKDKGEKMRTKGNASNFAELLKFTKSDFNLDMPFFFTYIAHDSEDDEDIPTMLKNDKHFNNCVEEHKDKKGSIRLSVKIEQNAAANEETKEQGTN